MDPQKITFWSQCRGSNKKIGTSNIQKTNADKMQACGIFIQDFSTGG